MDEITILRSMIVILMLLIIVILLLWREWNKGCVERAVTKMKVYAVIQKDEPDSRIRGIFSSIDKAQAYIGPPTHAMETCPTCSTTSERRIHNDAWRREKLSVHEWILDKERGIFCWMKD